MQSMKRELTQEEKKNIRERGREIEEEGVDM